MIIPLLGLEAMTRLRYAAPDIVGGRPIRPEATELAIQGSVQPSPENVREWLPAGYSIRRTKLLITYIDIQVGVEGGQYGDRILYDGTTYEVLAVKQFPAFLGQPKHWEAIMVDVQSMEPPQGVAP